MRCALIDRAAWQSIKGSSGHRRVTRGSIIRVCEQTEINERVEVCSLVPSLFLSFTPAHDSYARRYIEESKPLKYETGSVSTRKIAINSRFAHSSIPVEWLIHSVISHLFVGTPSTNFWDMDQRMICQFLMIWFMLLFNPSQLQWISRLRSVNVYLFKL